LHAGFLILLRQADKVTSAQARADFTTLGGLYKGSFPPLHHP
jgi:hypothetical protein